MLSILLKRILFITSSVLNSFCTFAQTDTEFWFAAPEVSTGPSLLDRPVFLRISTTDRPSKVTIHQPANSFFLPIVVDIAENATRTIDLSGYIDIIENKPANTILNYGLLITASTPVSVYYEVESSNCTCNPEIFSLKGKNALGTLFYTPFQNIWDNSFLVSYSPTPYSSFDIVATEDNTTVTITPKNDLVGRSAGISFSVVLNKGQTYSATASSQLASKHLGGSKISADKLIAVTIKDDLLYYPVQANNVLGIDLIGDQIVPVDIIGSEYIVQKGLLYNDEKVFILSTQPSTAIYLNGATNPVSTINTGETFVFSISDKATYIKSSKPVYVLHVSGFEYELGAALLPKVDCNGSRQVGFTRSNQQVFGLNLVVKKGGEGSFLLNGKSNIISATSFSAVTGTGGEWMAAQIEFNTIDVPLWQANLLVNTKSIFQMGLIDGNDAGASYGYFSDFAALNLGSDKNLCSGGSVTLDAGFGKDSYLWSDGSSNQTLTVTQAGKYWVKAIVGNCELADTLIINSNLVKVDLGNDIILCEGDKKLLHAANPGATYKWQDGSTNATFEVSREGKYWVEVTNACATGRDEVVVKYDPSPKFNLGEDTNLCVEGEMTLKAMVPNGSFRWQDGSTTNSYKVTEAGTYWVEVQSANCSKIDSITIKFVECAEDFYIPNVFTPNGDNVNETFFVRGILLGKWRLDVFNRWGKVIYQSKGYYNDWQAENITNGVYFYILYDPSTTKNYKGWVHIIR